MGFVAGRGTVPRSLGEHRGENRKLTRESSGSSSVSCECVTLWETQSDLDAGAQELAQSLPGTVGGNLASDFVAGIIHTEQGEFVLWL